MEQKSSQRRGFFKRAAVAGVLGALAAGVGFRAFAHGGWRSGEPLDPAKMEEHLDRMLKHLYVEIEATEEQKRRIAPIVKDAARDLMPLRGKHREAKCEHWVVPVCLMLVAPDGRSVHCPTTAGRVVAAVLSRLAHQ